MILTATALFGRFPITVKADTVRYAGAIYSITWNNQEFVNSWDHGRELQCSLQYDGTNECLNPTEAGCFTDGINPTSSSKILNAQSLSPHSFTTTCRMAWWLKNGETGASCPQGSPAVATLSDARLTKTVTVGALGIPNAIEYAASIDFARDHQEARFQVPVLHVPMPALSDQLIYYPRRKLLGHATETWTNSSFPVIFASPKADYAIGLYAPFVPQSIAMDDGYAKYKSPDQSGNPETSLGGMAARYYLKPAPIGIYPFISYVLVGTLQDVTHGMDALEAHFYP